SSRRPRALLPLPRATRARFRQPPRHPGRLRRALEAPPSEERHPEVLLERRQPGPVYESIGTEASAGADREAVEVDETARHQPAVPEDIKRQVERGAEHVAPQPVAMEEPGKECQQRCQFVRVKRQDDALYAPLEVVTLERGRPKVTLLLEDQIVEDVIEID